MLFNLSVKNIKKSIKDYSIYFFTLVIAVSIFYIFNSMDAQESMLIMNETKHQMVENLVSILSYISIFVSIVLGFLIIYSNNFLIKRRKKEIGLYLTLGMSKRKVSTILVIETLIVGIISLAVGLLLGVFLSQGLSIVTAKMFEADLSAYKFIFSGYALYKTVLYFGIIFFLVMIFNVIALSRYKLIDLLNAGKQNEKVKFRNKYIVTLSFILSLALMGYAYYLLFDDVLFMMSKKTLIMMICGALGTLLFFFSLSGFALGVTKKVKGVYYKGLNMFNLKQINSKINTSVISTTVITLMLLLTIGILASSISLASVFNRGIEENNQADFTLYSNFAVYEKTGIKNHKVDINKVEKDKDFSKYVKDYVRYDIYNNKDLNIETLMNEESIKLLHKQYGNNIETKNPVKLMKESTYHELMNLFGKSSIDIASNEYLELVNIDVVINFYSPAYKQSNTIKINGKTLKPGSKKIINTAIENCNSTGNDGVIVVSDEILQKDSPTETVLIGNYINKNKQQAEKDLKKHLENKEIPEILLKTKIDMEAASVNIKVLMTFVGLYLGIIFAISSVTILAIGELSSSSDNKERYKVLKQLGADNKMINKALFIQIFITFMLPLAVALFHAFFGLKEINSILKAIGNINISTSIILTTIFIAIVYGGYFIATYLCSKTIIKDK